MTGVLDQLGAAAIEADAFDLADLVFEIEEAAAVRYHERLPGGAVITRWTSSVVCDMGGRAGESEISVEYFAGDVDEALRIGPPGDVDRLAIELEDILFELQDLGHDETAETLYAIVQRRDAGAVSDEHMAVHLHAANQMLRWARGRSAEQLRSAAAGAVVDVVGEHTPPAAPPAPPTPPVDRERERGAPPSPQHSTAPTNGPPSSPSSEGSTGPFVFGRWDTAPT